MYILITEFELKNRKVKNVKHRDEILKLRAEGKTYKEIVNITGAAKGTVSYHCSEGQKEKYKKRNIKNRKITHPFKHKVSSFCRRFKSEKTILVNKNKTNINRLRMKVYSFHQDRKNKNMYQKQTFTAEEVISKFGEHPKCYLTGESIDIYQTQTYHFDHIIPVSKGGDNSLENLGICTKEANHAKYDLLLDDLLLLCKKILENNNHKVEKITE